MFEIELILFSKYLQYAAAVSTYPTKFSIIIIIKNKKKYTSHYRLNVKFINLHKVSVAATTTAMWYRENYIFEERKIVLKEV